MSAAELASLRAQIEQLKRDTGAQLAVLMVSTTAPEDIFAYRNRMLLSPPAAAYVSGYKHLPSRRQIGTNLPVPDQCRKRDIDHSRIVSSPCLSTFAPFSTILCQPKLDADKI